MLSLRTADGVDLMHLLTLSKAAAAAAAAVAEPAARAAAAEAALKLLLQPAATVEELLRCSAAVADCSAAAAEEDEIAAKSTGKDKEGEGALLLLQQVLPSAAKSTGKDKEGEGALLLLQQVLPSVLSGAAGYLRRPEVAEIRVYVHPNMHLAPQNPNSPSQNLIEPNFGAACASLLKELEEQDAELLETEVEGQWRLRILSSESDTAVAAKTLRLLHMLDRHRNSSSISCRMLLKAPDGLLLSDAVSRDIFIQLDEALKAPDGLLLSDAVSRDIFIQLDEACKPVEKLLEHAP
ncbi:radical SAM domain containing protein, putative [Eimeria praecox]|uniref:Radical SAM domain containing protein, putative n=1 Tax=Eimeria praecox TaxID=51316 RepID=U6H408_9EIME|nr:radical SAM domain containing protein, putative [Eimeria praecox]